MSSPVPRFSAASIKAFADSLGFPDLPDDVAASQASDVEFRIRQIIQVRLRTAHARQPRAAEARRQESMKFMRHGKRSVLTTDDVNAALRLRNVEARRGRAARAPRVLRPRDNSPCLGTLAAARRCSTARRTASPTWCSWPTES